LLSLNGVRIVLEEKGGRDAQTDTVTHIDNRRRS
jgi:hypothetical protein